MDLVQPEIMGKIVDDGILGVSSGGSANVQLILELGLLMADLVLLGGACGSLNNTFVHISGQNISNDMRKDCFARIMQFSASQMDSFGTGSLITRVTNDITQVQNFISQFIRGIIRTVMLMFGSIFMLFQISEPFGWIILCAFPLVIGCVVFCLYKVTPHFPILQKRLDEINTIMQEDISGIRTIKACVKENYEKVRFGKANDALVETQMSVLIYFAFMNPTMNVIMNFVVVLILYVGANGVQNGTTTPGVIMAAITHTTQLLNGVLMLVIIFQNITRGTASWHRVREVLHCKAALVDGDYCGKPQLGGEIEFRDVSFSYPGSNRLALNRINLKIKSGETVAIMGTTGCGKSTLVGLIPRFYDVTSGAVLVDGVDVRKYTQKALRKQIAIALQTSELFNMSIKDNILWGEPEASMEAVIRSAKTAQADGFISAAQNQYGTMVAERGASLSGGQKQRLSIARALLKRSPILIFDDSTSALDLKTEAELYAALERERPDCTKIFVAQRIASVRNADKIVVLNNGSIAAIGSHKELMESCAIYQDIYHSQIEGEDDKNV